jgi:hypothetical protein
MVHRQVKRVEESKPAVKRKNWTGIWEGGNFGVKKRDITLSYRDRAGHQSHSITIEYVYEAYKAAKSF